MDDNRYCDIALETNQEFVPPVVNSNIEAGQEQGTGNTLNNKPVFPINGGGSPDSEEEERKTSKNRKRKKSRHSRKRRRESSSSSDDSSSESSQSDKEDSFSSSPPPMKRFTITPKSEENNWKLPSTMAEYANKQFRCYISEKDIEESLLSKHPVPSNIQKVGKLDDFMKSILASQTVCLSSDAMMEKIQTRIRQIMGPLSRLWNGLEDVRSSKSDCVNVPIDEFVNLVEQTTFLVGQVSTSVTYNRRLGVLKSVFKDSRKAKTLLKEKSELLSSQDDDNLFGKKFRKYIVDTEKSKSKTMAVFNNSKEGKARDHLKKPFRGGPSSSTSNSKSNNRSYSNGGGRFVYNKNHRGGYSNNKYAGPKWQNNTGKYLFSKSERGSQLQQSSKSHSSGKFKTCSSSGKKFIYKINSKHSSGRKIKTLQPCLGEINPRSGNFVYGEGLRNSISHHPNTGENSFTNSHVFRSKNPSEGRDFEDVGKGSHSISKQCSRSIFEQSISSEKKEWRKSSSDKFEELEQICALPTFQNGRSSLTAFPLRAGRFPLQDRFEGCLLLCPSPSSISEICQVLMAGKRLRVYVPLFRFGASPQSVYKTLEGPCSSFEAIKHQDDSISRRYVDNGEITTRNFHGKGYIDFSITKSGVCNEHREVSFTTNKTNRISGFEYKFRDNDSVFNAGKGFQYNSTMSRDVLSICHTNSEFDQVNRDAFVNSTSSATCSDSISVSTRTANFSLERTEKLQRLCQTGETCQSRTSVVDKKSRNLQWQNFNSKRTRYGNSDGCLYDRMGSLLPGYFHRGEVVQGGNGGPHQCSRIDGSKDSHNDFHKGEIKSCSSSSDRQQDSTGVPVENGRHTKPKVIENQQINLGLSVVKADHNYCRVSSEQAKFQGRLGVEKLNGLLRLETSGGCFPRDLSDIWNTNNRSVCIQAVSSTSMLYGLETGSKQYSNGCNATTLGKPVRVCVSAVQPNQSGNKENSFGKVGENHSNNTSLADSTLVFTTLENLNSGTVAITTRPQHFERFTGNQSPPGKERVFKFSGVEGFRASLEMEGISKKAATLISQSRRPGSISNYDSSFSKWAGWCSGFNIDPFHAPINKLLDYLTSLFEKGLQYRTINCYRSAISAYHSHVNGKPVGEHPHVCALLAGVFNKRPPQPRYTFVWDVEVVLGFLKTNLSNNTQLSDLDLSQKLTALLALTAAQRVSSIHHLNIDFMVKNGTSYVFYFNKLHKSWKRGKAPPCITYQAYSDDPDLCVVEALNEYINRTQEWRKDSERSQLLLGTVKPHKPVVSSTISGWLKKLMARAGINTEIFKGHSTRSASTSKARSVGVPLEEILKRGSWSSSNTWHNFYNKDIVQEGKCFQDLVYRKSTL